MQASLLLLLLATSLPSAVPATLTVINEQQLQDAVVEIAQDMYTGAAILINQSMFGEESSLGIPGTDAPFSVNATLSVISDAVELLANSTGFTTDELLSELSTALLTTDKNLLGYQGVYLLGRGATKLLYVAGNMTDDPGTIAKALANTPAYTALLELVKAAEMLYYKSFTFTAPDTSPIVASSAGNGNACPSYTVWADAGVTATSLKGCTDSDIQSALGKVLSEVSYEEDALARYIFNVVCVPGGKISQQVADKITASLQKPLPIKLCDGNTCLCLQSGTASKEAIASFQPCTGAASQNWAFNTTKGAQIINAANQQCLTQSYYNYGYYITKPCADATANPYQLFSLLVDAATDTSYTMDLAYYREGTKREADTTWDCAVPESLGTTIEPGTHLVQRRCSCQPYQLVQRDFA